MNLERFEYLVSDLKETQEDLQYSLEVQSGLMQALAEITLRTISDSRYLLQAEGTLNKLSRVNSIVDDCRQEINELVSLLSENPN